MEAGVGAVSRGGEEFEPSADTTRAKRLSYRMKVGMPYGGDSVYSRVALFIPGVFPDGDGLLVAPSPLGVGPIPVEARVPEDFTVAKAGEERYKQFKQDIGSGRESDVHLSPADVAYLRALHDVQAPTGGVIAVLSPRRLQSSLPSIP